ncbi:hypothetical protein V3C99_017136 [Haemonchus contortus]|uniref:Reverse transcriptase domain-containing protein n=1 Tax=Haemonchus contortus TaxID=6289 RepID=A0A7I4Z8E6_HAECO
MGWEGMGVKVDGRCLHHPGFADDIVLTTPSIQQAERMLAEFDKLTKPMFMRNGLVPDAPFTLNGTNISECSSYAYLGRKVNMMNDLTQELSRRKRAACACLRREIEYQVGPDTLCDIVVTVESRRFLTRSIYRMKLLPFGRYHPVVELNDM